MGPRGVSISHALLGFSWKTDRKSSNLLSNVWVFSFGLHNYEESSLPLAWKIYNFKLKPFLYLFSMSLTGFLIGKLVYLATKLRDRIC